MDGETQQRQAPENVCPHCGSTDGICIAMHCLKCETLLCSRLVTPVLDTSPFYPYKHRIHGHSCGPVQPMLLPPAELS